MGKICAISDIHGDVSASYKVKEYLESYNISDVIMLGDYSASTGDLDENREDIQTIVNTIGNLSNIYALPGNCDALNVIEVLNSFGINYHKKTAHIGDFEVVFYGGSNKTPSGTPWEIEEDTIYSDLKELLDTSTEARHLLAVHAPPFDTKCDIIPGGAHVGSESIRKLIEEFKPEFVICSHIHECAGRFDAIGETTIVNIGRLGQGNFVEITSEGMEHKKL